MKHLKQFIERISPGLREKLTKLSSAEVGAMVIAHSGSAAEDCQSIRYEAPVLAGNLDIVLATLSEPDFLAKG
jgi:hypothetical protein